MEEKDYRIIGKSPIRKDAVEKATGEALYSPDIHPKGMLYAKIVGSEVAHGYIKSIDTSEAEALEGVIAVATGKDVPQNRTDGYIKDRHILCIHKVRYVGDPVAVVAAVSPDIAKKAAKLVKVEYEEIPAVFDLEEAFSEDCPVTVHEGLREYEREFIPGLYYRFVDGRDNVIVHRKVRHGDADEAFKSCDFVYEDEYVLPRAHHCTMEPHTCVCKPELDGGVTIWASEQGGVRLKYHVCEAFGIPSSKVHFIVPYLGGGFGGKVGIMVTPICTLIALKAGRPVKLELSRDEVFVQGAPRAPGIIRVKDGYMKDGTLVARKITQLVNGGAYSGHCTIMVTDGIYGATGTYRTPNLHIDAYGVYTNTPPTGPYRSLGSEHMCFAIECQMDRVAEILGIDKAEIRRKNLLVDGDRDGNNQVTYNNRSVAALEKAVEYIDWGAERRKPQGPWLFGKGISVGNKYTECGDSGTVAMCKVHDDGCIELRHFHVEMGQGCNTILAEIAAEEFDTSVDKIKVIFDDSQYCPYDEGTYCSRGTFMNGNAVRMACKKAKEKLLERAGEVMKMPAYKIGTKDGYVFEIEDPENKLPYEDLFDFGGVLPDGGELSAMETFVYPGGVWDPETGQGNPVTYYSYGAFAIECAINKITGEIRILRAGGWADMGQPLNRKLCEIQIEGALVMGIGQAIFEEMLFNDKGKGINGNFRDYKFPTMLDVPFNDAFGMDFVGKPHKAGPYGAKGMGEVAMVPVMPAVANAINDALGVKLNELPLTKERIYKALKKKEEAEKEAAIKE